MFLSEFPSFIHLIYVYVHSLNLASESIRYIEWMLWHYSNFNLQTRNLDSLHHVGEGALLLYYTKSLTTRRFF